MYGVVPAIRVDGPEFLRPERLTGSASSCIRNTHLDHTEPHVCNTMTRAIEVSTNMSVLVNLNVVTMQGKTSPCVVAGLSNVLAGTVPTSATPEEVDNASGVARYYLFDFKSLKRDVTLKHSCLD